MVLRWEGKVPWVLMDGREPGSSETGEEKTPHPPLVILCSVYNARDCKDCDLKGRVTQTPIPLNAR